VRVDAPEAWNIQASAAFQDIDNLRCDLLNPPANAPAPAGGRKCGDPDTPPASELTKVTYALKTLLVAGQCFQNAAGAPPGSPLLRQHGAPPNGLQLTLSPTAAAKNTTATAGAAGAAAGEAGTGTGPRRAVSDTLVMQNLGYYQLQAQPGLWTLRLAPGT